MSCDYQGHEFGAPYPDSVCIEGYLWDADSGEASPDGEGWLYSHGGDLPCPKCNTAAYLEGAKETAEAVVEAETNGASYSGEDVWKRAVERARRENPRAAEEALRLIGTVRALRPAANEDRCEAVTYTYVGDIQFGEETDGRT